MIGCELRIHKPGSENQLAKLAPPPKKTTKSEVANFGITDDYEELRKILGKLLGSFQLTVQSLSIYDRI